MTFAHVYSVSAIQYAANFTNEMIPMKVAGNGNVFLFKICNVAHYVGTLKPFPVYLFASRVRPVKTDFLLFSPFLAALKIQSNK